MDRKTLNDLEMKINDILTGKVHDIIVQTRQNMVVVEEKADGDSATVADIKIGEIFDEILPQLLEGSIVVQEESFNEEVYKKALETKYIWVVDPIDGTKAFRDTSNSEWCVGVCLLENMNPILSHVYIPEPWLKKPYLISANKFRDGLLNFGFAFEEPEDEIGLHYVSHIHRDTERNEIENKIAELFENNDAIRAYAGHSTLAQFAEVSINSNKIFTRRGANIWDIIQSAYLISKNNGEVFYENGESIFPLKPEVLEYKDNHLLMPFTIACDLKYKNKILNKLKTAKD